MEILKKDILKEMEEKSIDNRNKGIDIAVSILKNEFTFVTGWKYKHDPDFFNTTVYILLICDMDKSSEFYNSPIKDYYKNLEADVTYPFSPLEMSTEIDNEEKYKLYKEIQKSLDETYYEIPNDYRHTYKSYLSNTDSPKEIYIDGFVFPAPEKLNESESVNYKVSLAKSLIHQLFDEVNYIKISEYHDKPLIKVYFDSDDTAANIESFFTHEICDTLKDYTGGEIVCNPGWGPEWRTNRNNPDILIGSSWGGAVALNLIERGLWNGPTILLAPAYYAVNKVIYNNQKEKIFQFNLAKVANLKGKVLVYHSKNDETIPFQDSIKLCCCDKTDQNNLNMSKNEMIELRLLEDDGHKLNSLIVEPHFILKRDIELI
jgi:hypothetical protein